MPESRATPAALTKQAKAPDEALLSSAHQLPTLAAAPQCHFPSHGDSAGREERSSHSATPTLACGLSISPYSPKGDIICVADRAFIPSCSLTVRKSAARRQPSLLEPSPEKVQQKQKREDRGQTEAQSFLNPDYCCNQWPKKANGKEACQEAVGTVLQP